MNGPRGTDETGGAAELNRLYEELLRCAELQKEAAGRGDMEAFDAHATRREGLQAEIEALTAGLLKSGGCEAEIREACAVARRVSDVDGETARLLETSRLSLVDGLSGVEIQRRCIAAYGSVVRPRRGTDAFVNRLK
ncbi:MAG: hypothetical protein NUV93_03400 [Firmicutes bacterium]|nr:hypothetical protein [Bacillota bacterium]